MGDGLVKQRQRIAHAARRALGQMAQGGRLERHALRLQHARQMIDDVRQRHLLEVELKTTGQYRYRDFLRIGRSKDKFNVLRRLLQGLQQAVRGTGRRLIDVGQERHATGRFQRQERKVRQQLAGRIHFER